MAGRLKLYTVPAVEPVIPADLRTYGRISSDVVDATLTPIIKAAREAAEGYLNRALINQTWDYILDAFPYCPFDLPRPPLVSLTSITVTDIAGTVTTIATTDFVIDTSGCKGSISLKYGKYWPTVIPERAGIVIRFLAGYGAAASAVPEQFKTAITLAALWLFDHPTEEMTPAFYVLLDLERVMPV